MPAGWPARAARWLARRARTPARSRCSAHKLTSKNPYPSPRRLVRQREVEGPRDRDGDGVAVGVARGFEAELVREVDGFFVEAVAEAPYEGDLGGRAEFVDEDAHLHVAFD